MDRLCFVGCVMQNCRSLIKYLSFFVRVQRECVWLNQYKLWQTSWIHYWCRDDSCQCFCNRNIINSRLMVVVVVVAVTDEPSVPCECNIYSLMMTKFQPRLNAFIYFCPNRIFNIYHHEFQLSWKLIFGSGQIFHSSVEFSRPENKTALAKECKWTKTWKCEIKKWIIFEQFR